MKIAYFLMLLCVTLFSCRQKIQSRGELLRYLKNKDNGLLKEDRKMNVITSATYVPTQLLSGKGLNIQDTIEIPASRLRKMCFIIHFSSRGKELLNQLSMDFYSDILQTLSFRMMPLISLKLADNQVISPVDCFLQQTYGLSSANELMVIFNSDRIDLSNEYKLIISEFGLGIGELKYKFSRSDIDRLNKTLKM